MPNEVERPQIEGDGSTKASDRFARQSFLGPDSQDRIERAVVGVVGLGGGGSHIVQQLAHIGFQHYVLYDGDQVEDTNLNRLVGATVADVTAATFKIEVARRIILGLQPRASIRAFDHRWQQDPQPLRECDLVFGCVDSFAERWELEVLSRRYLVPYIDIGMDVHQVGGEPPAMGGQVILSLPGDLCMFCMGFLTNERLAKEAAQYGAAGGRPQVVWPNGVLASTAVGIAVELTTDWSRSLRGFVYMSYRGSTGTVQPHARVPFLRDIRCDHYRASDVGDPRIMRL